MDSAWMKDISQFKKFSFDVAETFFKSKGWAQRASNREYKFFAEGYLHDVFAHKHERTVRAKCYKSQKKNDKPHTLHLSFSSSMEAITKAHCTCEAGNSESCNHVVALAYYLQHSVLLGIEAIPEDASSTSLPMMWNKPRGKKITAEQLTDSIFSNPMKKVRTKDPVVSKIRNAIRNQELTKLMDDKLVQLKTGLESINKNIPFASTLSLERINDSRTILLRQDVYVPSSSVLGHQARANQEVQSDLLELEEPREELPIDLPVDNKEMVDILISRAPVHNNYLQDLSIDEAAAIEQQTRKQTGVDLWWNMRKLRFTASKFGYICKRRLFNDEFVKQFTTSEKSISNVKAVIHGRKYESVAAECFVNSNLPLKFYKCGLIIHPYALHLGSSPDGIIFDSQKNLTVFWK